MQFKWHPDESPPQIEDHSKAKLSVLRRYLRLYFDRLNANPNREVFKVDLVDGFAGGGTFRDHGQIVSGTPLIMLEELQAAEERLNLNRNKQLIFDCSCYFVELESAHSEHLRNVLTERGYTVDDSKIILRNNSFKYEIDDIIANIQRRQPLAGRAIFLLDQTGFSQVELALVRRIFEELPAAEVILTFAADALINHLTSSPALVKAVAPLELLERDLHQLVENHSGVGGRALIQRTLRDHIRTITGAAFDTPFFVVPRGSRRALWFIHLSQHPTARDVMMRIHWETQNTFQHYGRGDFRMLGWDALESESLSLFHFEELDIPVLHDQLLETMPNKLFGLASEYPISITEMRIALANETAARFSDLDDVVLRLFREGELQILTPDDKLRSRTLKTLKPTDRIAFPDILMLPGISRITER